MGFPFLTGFYSKDIILEIAYSSYSTLGVFSYFMGILSVFLTAFYSFRLIYLVFFTKTNSYKKIIENVHEVPFFIFLSNFFTNLYISLNSK